MASANPYVVRLATFAPFFWQGANGANDGQFCTPFAPFALLHFLGANDTALMWQGLAVFICTFAPFARKFR